VQRYIRAILTASIALTLFSVTLVPYAHATKWVGNDNGEWQESAIPSVVQMEGWLGPSNGIAWSSSPPSNTISLQYNPDKDQSFWFQNNVDWFQTVIGSDANGCALYTVQVYSLITYNLVWSVFDPTSGCTNVPGILKAEAGWYIREDMTNNVVTDVFFELWGFGYSPYSTTLYPPPNWIWIRSNACWCGADGGTATFTTAGGGTLSYVSDQNIVQEDPPIDIATSENSNMQYGCFQLYRPTLMIQSFGLSGHC
jgi:hypothetical protein